ncbi:carbonic anhydrase [Erysipelothrix rhusiopathiae]|nr:carbonic anhydrase [Erysipelothrix rhusiopathiae]
MRHKWENSLDLLKDGNLRFTNQTVRNSHHAQHEMEDLGTGQNPYAIILSCSDSRVSPDIIFDCKLGDLFLIQNAGNISDSSVLGSIEYAVENLKTPLVVVLGHSQCGAISAAFNNLSLDGNLKTIVDQIKGHILSEGIDHSSEKHAQKTASEIADNSSIKRHDVKVVSAFYDITTGLVSWL